MLEGEAVRVEAAGELKSVAEAYEAKYGARFTAPEGTWFGLGDAIRGGDALVFQVVPSTAFGFEKGLQFSQTRWRFSEGSSASSPVGGASRHLAT